MGDFEPFLVFDFETATEVRNSACELGLAIVSGFDDVKIATYRIRPMEERVAVINRGLHGISWDDLRDCDEWPAVWDKVRSLFTNYPIVAHNLGFDLSVLKATCQLYGIQLPGLRPYCSYRYFRRRFPNLESHRLVYLAEDAGMEFAHHEAAADAAVCAKLLVCQMKSDSASSIAELMKIVSFERPENEPLDIIDGSLVGMAFCFTGEFVSGTRESVWEETKICGGIVHERVIKATDYLVIGGYCGQQLDGGPYSGSKVRKALADQQKGGKIKVVSEDEWRSALRRSSNIT